MWTMSNPTFEQEKARLAALPRAERFEELIAFPCEHTFKVIAAPEGLEQRVRDALATRGQPTPHISRRTSSNGRWLSLSVTVQVASGVELDQLYAALEGLRGLKMLV